MTAAAAAVRDGADLDDREVREAVAWLLDTAAHDAGTGVTVALWDRIAHLADRVLTGPAHLQQAPTTARIADAFRHR